MFKVKRLALVLLISLVAVGLVVPLARANDYFDAIRHVIEIVQSEHYREIDTITLIKGALAGIMQAVSDPHSSYMPPVAFEDYWEQATGEYIGIGVVFEVTERGVKVIQVLDNSPASRAGIRAGDILLEVDGKQLRGLAANDIRSLFQVEDAEFTIVLRRSDASLTVKVKAEKIITPSAEWRIIEDEIAYIKIRQFGTTLANEIEQALAEMSATRAIILDLRGCPGGLLESVIAVSGYFVPESPFIRLQSRGGETEVINSPGPGIDKPLLVLTDGRTASAAEILAGAIQDTASGRLIGSKTYGKGVAQSVYHLNKELGGIRITSMKFLTPLGRDYEGKGLEPDIWADAISIRYDKELAPLVVTNRILRQGLSGQDVSLLQDALRALGHFDYRTTGYFGTITSAAVRSFQTKAGLPVSGVADETTLYILNNFHLRTPIYSDGILQTAMQTLNIR